MSVTIRQGSILDAKTDVIVNPANGHLRHGGGLAAVIAKAAAPLAVWNTLDEAYNNTGEDVTLFDQDHVWAREQANAPLIATGNAYATSAGRLPYKAIIHAVGPIWNGGHYLERDLLELTHEYAIIRADEIGADSIAIPAISCGIFGFPVETAAPIAVNVASWSTNLDIQFWLFEDEHVKAYRKALG